MAKEQKKRPQYNWKFKENESEEFYEWFNNQDNIASSLRSILYYIIDLYGNEDVLHPAVQKEMFKNNLILETLKNKDVLSINSSLISDYTPQNTDNHEVENSKEINTRTIPGAKKKKEIDRTESENSSIYSGIDQDLL